MADKKNVVCPASKVRNPATGRCVLRTGRIGRQVVKRVRNVRGQGVSRRRAVPAVKRTRVHRVAKPHDGAFMEQRFLKRTAGPSVASLGWEDTKEWDHYGPEYVTTSLDPRRSKGGVAWMPVENSY